MTIDKRPEPELHSRFSFESGLEPSFEIVETDGEARESVLRTLKQVNFGPEDEPHEVLKVVTALIDEAISEGKVPAEERENLIMEARKNYCRLFNFGI